MPTEIPSSADIQRSRRLNVGRMPHEVMASLDEANEALTMCASLSELAAREKSTAMKVSYIDTITSALKRATDALSQVYV